MLDVVDSFSLELQLLHIGSIPYCESTRNATY